MSKDKEIDRSLFSLSDRLEIEECWFNQCVYSFEKNWIFENILLTRVFYFPEFISSALRSRLRLAPGDEKERQENKLNCLYSLESEHLASINLFFSQNVCALQSKMCSIWSQPATIIIYRKIFSFFTLKYSLRYGTVFDSGIIKWP